MQFSEVSGNVDDVIEKDANDKQLNLQNIKYVQTTDDVFSSTDSSSSSSPSVAAEPSTATASQQSNEPKQIERNVNDSSSSDENDNDQVLLPKSMHFVGSLIQPMTRIRKSDSILNFFFEISSSIRSK